MRIVVLVWLALCGAAAERKMSPEEFDGFYSNVSAIVLSELNISNEFAAQVREAVALEQKQAYELFYKDGTFDRTQARERIRELADAINATATTVQTNLTARKAFADTVDKDLAALQVALITELKLELFYSRLMNLFVTIAFILSAYFGGRRIDRLTQQLREYEQKAKVKAQ
jgi:hypothetical protein